MPAKTAIDSLAAKAFELQYNNPRGADSIADIIYDLSQKHEYKQGIAESWFLKSSAQQQLGNYDSAIVLVRKSLEISERLKDKQGIARCYNDLGICYDFKANYSKAIENYLKALKLFEELGDMHGQANAYNNIGLIHQNESNYKVAEENYRKAYAISVKYSLEDSRLNAMNNLGSNYNDLGNYDSALRYFTSLLAEDLQSGNKSYIASSLNNVGEAYLGMKDYERALLHFEKSKKLKEELGNQRALANTLNNLGRLYLETHRYELAENYLTRAETTAARLDVPEIQKDALELLHTLHISKGDYKTALEYYKKFEHIKSEIGYDKKQAEISRLEKDFELEKAGHQIEQVNRKVKENKLLVAIYLAVIVVLVLLLVSGWLVLRQKHKTSRIEKQYSQRLEAQNKELEEKNKEIGRQKTEVETALAARSRFLSFMSHEVRTPLNGIMGLVDLLQSQQMAPGQEEYIEALKRSAENLMLLLNNVLDLSRLETGGVELESMAVDIRKVLGDQVLLYSGSAMLRNTTLEVWVDEDVPHTVESDPYRLGQIIANLVNNAIKFTRNGKILVQCRLKTKDDMEATLLFEIIDTGIGIPEDQLENIMQPFLQAEAYTTRVYGGTGLGLSIVGRLLQLMGSRLQVKSKPGEGARFYFTITLPLRHSKLLQEEKIPETDTQPGMKGLKVLVIEDNTTNILLFSRMLAAWHTEYDIAGDGYKALEFAAQKKYGIILLDLHLPGISGYEVAAKLRTTENINSITPILAIMAADESEVKNHPQARYFDGVIYKPVKYEELLENIKTMVKQ